VSGKRSEATLNIKQENDGESKKKLRKVDENARRHTERASEEPLDSPLLTRKVWDELFNLFKLHFSTEMSFIHPPTFRTKMRDAAYPRESPSQSIPPQDKLLLLGVLTLVARFHPELIAHHSESKIPVIASEYYATALAATLGPMGGRMTKPSLEGVQALLMLALYEWSQPCGLGAWVHLGIAIRLAQSMGLEYEDDPEVQNQKPRGKTISDKSQEDAAIEKEVRRRTIWSCFFMDRVFSAGKFRPSMMQSERLNVFLPLPERNFLFVDEVRTGYLSQPQVTTDGVLSRHIRLVEIFGRLSVWSYAGGRRTETLPPWDRQSKVYLLRQQLESFHDTLPPKLAYTTANLSAHLEQGNATPYISMHTLYFLCLIILHREYIPYSPLICKGPEGPLDEPTFPKDKYDVPPNFWTISAEREFRAARDIIDMVRICQESSALPESPLIVFAVYQAAFVVLYAACFPHMDVRSHVSSPEDTKRGFRQNRYLNSALDILRGFRPKSRITDHYLKTMRSMERELEGVLTEWTKSGKAPAGGGLELYKIYEKDLKEIVSLEDSERHTLSDGSDIIEQTRSRASTNEYQSSSAPMDLEQRTEVPSTSRGSTWAPVNAPSILGSNERPHLPEVVYHQSPNPSSAVPSDTTPSVHSPYSTNQPFQPHSVTQAPQNIPYQQPVRYEMPPPTIIQDGDRQYGMDAKGNDFVAMWGNPYLSLGAFSQTSETNMFEDNSPPDGTYPFYVYQTLEHGFVHGQGQLFQ
jgi:hypothetical protein